jgi:hypothetical protein
VVFKAFRRLNKLFQKIEQKSETDIGFFRKKAISSGFVKIGVSFARFLVDFAARSGLC